MPAKVIVRELQKSYGEVHAARGVSFDVQAGEIFGLLGPNGAGKTTTVECVVGLRDPDAGHIEILGIDARRHPAEVKQKMGAALQTTSLQDKITPREALRVFGSFYRERFEPQQLLDRFALTDKADSAFDTLSGGQKQRLALALAFVNNPELIFLDEPTTGLDPQSRRDLHTDIVAMKRDGHTVLLTTHNISEAERLCDRIAIMDRGHVVATGTPRELIAQSTAALSVFLATVQPVDGGLLARIPGIQNVTSENSGFRFSAARVTKTVAELMKFLDSIDVDIAELHVQKATLEDVLIEMTSAERGNG
jgi:ABC-2 type transport system ATP-binding protein